MKHTIIVINDAAIAGYVIAVNMIGGNCLRYGLC